MEIDQIDKSILKLVQRDASLSNQELAQQVGVSTATCLRRVQRLQSIGLLAHQVTLLDPKVLRKIQPEGLTGIVEVTLDRQGAEELRAFEAHICAFDEVQQCYQVSSGPDFILVAYATDMQAWQTWVQRALTTASNIRNVRTFFSQARAKLDLAYPLA